MIKLNLNSFRDLESIPSPSLKIVKVLDQLDTPPLKDFDVLTMIQDDPGVACGILKVANTPLYGFPAQIHPISAHPLSVRGSQVTARNLSGCCNSVNHS